MWSLQQVKQVCGNKLRFEYWGILKWLRSLQLMRKLWMRSWLWSLWLAIKTQRSFTSLASGTVGRRSRLLLLLLGSWRCGSIMTSHRRWIVELCRLFLRRSCAERCWLLLFLPGVRGISRLGSRSRSHWHLRHRLWSLRISLRLSRCLRN